ncbi:MAG: TetR/AcrR family transcriptional regulator [Actinobacteria bacterium]|nr:TetR/AcrR family transcriptional regulator [Actinomycetota bacterium]
MRDRQHRALVPEAVEVGIRVVDERLIEEEVEALPIRQRVTPPEGVLCNCLARGRKCGNVVAVATTPSARRIGTKDSQTRAQLVDAAERLLLEEGYAAVTSRKVAAAAGLKPQLVHYYFRTMEDLYLEIFRRQAEANISGFEQAVADGVTLQQLWRMNADARAAVFTIEFVALANHHKAIKAELARFAERFRSAQQTAFARALAAAGVDENQLPPVVGLLLMTGLAQVLGLEQMIGVTTGHAETKAFVDDLLAGLEVRPVTPSTRRRRGSRRR